MFETGRIRRQSPNCQSDFWSQDRLCKEVRRDAGAVLAVLPWIWDYSPDAWSAIAAAATLVVAVVAAGFAWRQVREAQKTREEQAQPFVVVDLDRTEASRIHMDLVIVNTGTTLAKDVRVAFDPPLRSTLTERNQQYDLADAAIISHGIPTMPPGREFRMLFESMPGLFESDLPRTYGAVVSFRDSRGRPYQLDYRLDQRLFRLDADRREG